MLETAENDESDEVSGDNECQRQTANRKMVIYRDLDADVGDDDDVVVICLRPIFSCASLPQSTILTRGKHILYMFGRVAFFTACTQAMRD